MNYPLASNIAEINHANTLAQTATFVAPRTITLYSPALRDAVEAMQDQHEYLNENGIVDQSPLLPSDYLDVFTAWMTLQCESFLADAGELINRDSQLKEMIAAHCERKLAK